MKKSRFLAIIAIVMIFALCFTACGKKHECESVCDECSKCTDASCTEDACADKCAGHQSTEGEGNTDGGNTEVKTTPVITVVAESIEIHAGDEIDLGALASVTDEGDDAVTVIIADDDDFDADTEGVYTITYTATNKHGNTATATVTVTVLEALPIYTLEVQVNYLGETKWQGTKINFKNKLFVNLTADATYGHGSSGIYYNSTDAELTLNIGGDYGEIAVIDANGVVVEGRDGANARIVNEQYPVRANSPQGSLPAAEFGKDVKIPAGGYAIVVCTGYAGTGVDADGRSFMAYNVINQLGNVVRITLEGKEAPLTTYVDQAPVISGNGNAAYATDSNFVLSEDALEGVTAKDDNGTFDPSDDVEVDVTVTGDGEFDILTPGSYYVTLSATDSNGNTATATREVKVTTEVKTVSVGENSYTTLKELVVVDPEITTVGGYLFIVYTYEYKANNETLDFTNGWSEAFILNKYGEVIRIYDGWNGKYYDKDNIDGISDATKCTAAGCLTEAYASLGEGEYLLFAPNSTAAANTSRKFLVDNKKIGAIVTISDVTFEAHESCDSVCGNCNKCLDDTCPFEACAEKCECHKCESLCSVCGGCLNEECEEYYCETKCSCEHICANQCKICGKCTNGSCTEDVCVSNQCAGHTGSKVISINGKTFESTSGKWAYNDATVTSSTVTNYSMIIYDKSYTGTVSINGWGAALVLDSTGKLVRVYDGAYDALYTEEGKASENNFTTSDYATVAFSELQDGETLIIFPNGGLDNCRAFALGCRTDGSIGQIAEFYTVE